MPPGISRKKKKPDILAVLRIQTLYTTTTVETVPSREVEVHLFRWDLNFSEGVHLFSTFI